MKNADQVHQKTVRLHDLLVEYFNLEEVRLLCFNLGIDYEDLAGSNKSTKTLNLITYMQRRGTLNKLVDEVKKQRSHVDWPDFSSTNEDPPVKETRQIEQVSGDQVGGDTIEQQINSEDGNVFTGSVNAARDVIGGDQIFQGDVTIGKDRRDDQYDIALNWDGKTRMREFDLAGRDLSGLYLANSDLRRANLQGADLRESDLSGADLSGADLYEADLRQAKYTILTTWPDNFEPKSAGASLVNDTDSFIDAGYSIPEKDANEDTYIDKKTGLLMIHIPAGEFIFGEDNRLEYLPEFWIAKTPVTNALYFRFVRETGHVSPDHWEGETPKVEIADHPVVNVSYEDAVAYADWARMTLPTEKEWEKAARGTDGRIYPWGDEWRDGYYCNTEEAGIGTTTPVGQYSPVGDSPYGCVDMAGNVFDWTASWYDEEEEWGMLRGGSWNFERDIAQTANRDGTPITDRINDIGFRVVMRRFPAQ